MKNWALVHSASGAIVATTSVRVFDFHEGLEVIAAPAGLDGRTSWWTGDAFAAREDAEITVSCAHAAAGQSIAVNRPQGAWMALSDGTMTDAADIVALGSMKVNRFTLVGRYRGEAAIEIVPSSPAEAIAAVRRERDRRLASSDRYVLPDFPISETDRDAWMNYRADLRGLPEAQPSASLATVIWPALPNGGDA